MNTVAKHSTLTSYNGGGCKRWLSLKEAVTYSGMGITRLKKLATDGVIKGWPDPDNKRGDWVFDLLSIDEYRENQNPHKGAKQKALELLRGIAL